MKPISMEQVLSLQTAKQHFCDCYLVASLNALSRSQNGRRILQNNILTDGEAYCVRFNNVYGEAKTYLAKQEECDQLILMDRYLNPIEINTPHNPIVKAVEIAMQKLLKEHPFKKPFLSKQIQCQENFENNKPSNFLYMFTGIKPFVINEGSLFSMNLRAYRNLVEELLKRIRQENNSSFVAGTGYSFSFDNLLDLHCYALNWEKGTNKEADNFINLFDGRKQANLLKSDNELIKRFKYICGYFNDSLS